jgi:SRSO17 transposase
MSKARKANPTVTFIDEYCRLYQDLFPDVRSFEHFTFLHVGMLSDIKRKTLPAIAKVAGDLDPRHSTTLWPRLRGASKRCAGDG